MQLSLTWLDLCCRCCASVAGSAVYLFENPSVYSKVRRSASLPPLLQSLLESFAILLAVSALALPCRRCPPSPLRGWCARAEIGPL